MKMATDIYSDVLNVNKMGIFGILVDKAFFSFIVFIDRHYFYDYI